MPTCQYRYIRTEITRDLDDDMPDSILVDQISSSSFLSQSPPAGPKLDILRKNGAAPSLLGHRPISREDETPTAAEGRSRIWDFPTHLHCSIIGTCLSTAELKQILTKLGHREAAAASEHDLHASGVLLASQRQGGAKLLHKALDRRHRVAINQFAKAKTTEEVRALWQHAVQQGEIPGAYWASLTHPATNDSLLREIFAEVHMLSHLVGAANRADISELPNLLRETDQVVFGDAGYASDEYKRGARALGMVWRVQDKAKPKGSLGAALSGSQKKRNRRNSAIRARVEHFFRIVKRQFGYTKVRYRGLAKNAAQVMVLIGLANLYALRRRLVTA